MADVVGMRASEDASPWADPGDEDYAPPIEWSGDAWMYIEFDGGYGSAEGCRFTVWTAKRVYFPTEYDGLDGCSSAPRDPCDEAMRHV
jgi:hypothetical protein